MTAHCFSGGGDVVVLDTKLLAGLLHDGSDARVMGLDDPGEEVVCDLMIEGTSEYCPEPVPCGIVLGCGNLQLRPKVMELLPIVSRMLAHTYIHMHTHTHTSPCVQHCLCQV